MNFIFEELQKTYNYSNYQIALIKYALSAIFSECSKLILLSLFYIYIGRFSYFFMSICVLLLLRINGGGFHCKHYITCLLFTFLLLLASVVILPKYISLNPVIMLISLMICLLINYYIGPIASPFRPSPDSLLLKSCKNNCFLVIFIYIIIVSIFNTNIILNIYLTIGYWTIILHTLQMILAKILMKGRYEYEIKEI